MVHSPLTRAHPRHAVHKIASYQHGGKTFLTVTLDLGLGGMKIKTHRHLPEDENLSFKLVLEKDVIWVRGRIVYSKLLTDEDTVSGIQFMELSHESHALLGEFLNIVAASQQPRGMLGAGERKGEGPAWKKKVEA